MNQQLLFVGAAVAALVFLIFGAMAIVARFYRQVEQGRALIVNTMGKEPVVSFTGSVVYPVINRAETMDLSVKTIEIDRRGKEGLICNDNIRADINVTFFVRVNKTREDVLKVAQSIGCARASDHEILKELFSAKFAEALKTVGKHFDFDALYTKRDAFKDKIIQVIGQDLNGFILDDAAIDYLEQTPLEALDRDNIMDADGIRKITEITVTHNVQTNELRQKERMEMGSQNLNADEAVFRFEQRRAEAEAKKQKEIAIAQSREQNEALRIASEEQKKTALVHHKNEEEALVVEQAKMRGVAIAQKARERELAVEQERVEKARQLEVIGRERDVTLVGIARDKEVELQKKEIADVIRARVAVDKTVAQEEETIKDVRVVAAANREREAIMIKSDAEAQAAERTANAKMRIAEGVQAEKAAEGLARARVKEAEMQAEASGIRDKAAAMKALDDAGRIHEEFRLTLDKEKTVELETIRAKKEAAAGQAQVLAQAFTNAKFNIVGGDGAFFERFVKAVSVGQAIDGVMDNSTHVRSLVEQVVKPDDNTVLDMVQKIVTDPGAQARIKAIRDGR